MCKHAEEKGWKGVEGEEERRPERQWMEHVEDNDCNS